MNEKITANAAFVKQPFFLTAFYLDFKQLSSVCVDK